MTEKIFDLAYEGGGGLIAKNKLHIRDTWGNTPLHYAAISPSLTSFEALIAKGADPHALNDMGGTPFLMRKLIQPEYHGEIENYPLLSDIYMRASDVYHFWKEGRPGEKWVFLKMLPTYSGAPKQGSLLSVVSGDPIVGRRVFAKKSISAGQIICEYLGEFYPAVFYTEEMKGLFDLPIGLFKKVKKTEAEYINGCIDARLHGNEAALIGDGTPNVEFIPSPCTEGMPLRMMVKALSDIQQGEEVAAYYMAHPLRYSPHYVELNPERRKERIIDILSGRIGRAEEWFLRYLFHTPYLLIPLLKKGEIKRHECKVLLDHTPEEISWIRIPKESEWELYLAWMGRALDAFSSISFPHTRLFFDSLREMSFSFEKRELTSMHVDLPI